MFWALDSGVGYHVCYWRVIETRSILDDEEHYQLQGHYLKCLYQTSNIEHILSMYGATAGMQMMGC